MRIRSMALASIFVGFAGLSIGCSDKDEDEEETECDDGEDNDDDGDTDCDDSDCEGTADCPGDDEVCDDEVDNDGDGDVDCADDDCEEDFEACPTESEEGYCDDNEDNDGDGDEDCDDSDCDDDPDCEIKYFEPDVLFFYGEVMITDGNLGGITYEGAALDSYFMLYMVDNDEWEGTTDEDNACILYYLLDDTSATLSSEFSTDFWQGWAVDNATAYVGNAGRCEDLDPDVYGEGDISEYWADVNFGMGFGPLSTDFRDILEASFGDDYYEYEDYWISGPISYDYGGSATLAEMNYSLAFEVDDEGELVVDGDGYLSFIDVSEASFAPNGYYRSYMAYGVGL